MAGPGGKTGCPGCRVPDPPRLATGATSERADNGRVWVLPLGLPAVSGRVPILVNEPAEDVDAVDTLCRPRRHGRRLDGLRHGEAEAAVRPGGVVVRQIGGQHAVQVPAVEDQDPVQALGPNGPHPPLGIRQLGYGGHFFTKSRRYTTTFRIIRAARRTWVRRQADLDTEATNATEVVITSWAFGGVGWRTTGDALLAQTSATLARERRRIAREELVGAYGRRVGNG
jgi:hypothetical protein